MKPGRTVLWWILGSVVLSVVYFLFLNDVAKSLVWHLTHGNKVVFQGHSMTLPLLWRVEYRNDSVLKLARAAFFHPFVDGGLSGPESMTIGRHSSGGGNIDDAAAVRWQNYMVAAFQSSHDYASPENLHAGSMHFYCFNRDDGSTHGGCLDCKATGTDWEITFGVGDGGAGPVQGQLQEAREIMKSIQ